MTDKPSVLKFWIFNSAGSGPDFLGLERAQQYKLRVRALWVLHFSKLSGSGGFGLSTKFYVRARALCVRLLGHFGLRILLSKTCKISILYKSKIIVQGVGCLPTYDTNGGFRTASSMQRVLKKISNIKP